MNLLYRYEDVIGGPREGKELTERGPLENTLRESGGQPLTTIPRTWLSIVAHSLHMQEYIMQIAHGNVDYRTADAFINHDHSG